MTDLFRFSVTIPEDMLRDFDRYVEDRGVSKNRSEAIRDLIREALDKKEWEVSGVEAAATIMLEFDCADPNLLFKLESIKRGFRKHVMSCSRIYVDESDCVETIVLRGEGKRVSYLANLILGTKGIRRGTISAMVLGEL